MKRVARFLILAAVGFALGAGLAYVQGAREQKAMMQQMANVSETAKEAADATPAAGEVAATEKATEAVEAGTEATHDMSHDAMDHDMSGMNDKAMPVAGSVVGSSVGGAFTLTDQNGNAVTEASWPDQYKLVFFGFTHCPDICPVTLDKLTNVLNALGDDATKVQTLFVTVDPERDTPEVLKTYLEGYHPSILGLSGSEEQVRTAKNAYKVYAAKAPGADPQAPYMLDHSTFVFLMSKDGEMMDLFRMDDPAEVLVEKVKARIAE